MCFRSVDYHLVVTDVEKGSVAAEDVSSPSPPLIVHLTSDVFLVFNNYSQCLCMDRQTLKSLLYGVKFETSLLPYLCEIDGHL